MKEFELAFPFDRQVTTGEVEEYASRQFGPGRYVVSKRSLDARGIPLYRYKVVKYAPSEDYHPYQLPEYKNVSSAEPVIVVGAGPAGMFASLRLLMLGFRPVVLERGKDVHSRKKDMAALSRTGVLNPDSNYCYGEGGAGAFSDGKLFTRSSKRGDIREVLYQLVRFGASETILTDAHPHIGSDKLPTIVENIRKCIISHGGEYHFDTRVTGINGSEGDFELVSADGKSFRAPHVILATGHSARDIYEMLASMSVKLEAKGFALGVRVEHPQRVINESRYHGHYFEGLPAAEYSFVQQVDGRGVFSFCMCPGGILVPSSTESGTVVLNGMSNSSRNSRWANAGVVVQIEPGDAPEKYARDACFSLMNFQRDIERSMFIGSGHPMTAPAQRMTDFCKGRLSTSLPGTSYFPGAVSTRLDALLPQTVSYRLRKALPAVERNIRGFYTNDALMLGVESRTSSPMRIVRSQDSLEACGLPGVYPCGEGAGYSGGIVSSAIDGIRCANALAQKNEVFLFEKE